MYPSAILLFIVERLRHSNSCAFHQDLNATQINEYSSRYPRIILAATRVDDFGVIASTCLSERNQPEEGRAHLSIRTRRRDGLTSTEVARVSPPPLPPPPPPTLLPPPPPPPSPPRRCPSKTQKRH
ncbi:hypothetical protein ALC60_09668 [Trachymyrmex zeteki]|uniref:Uncharacterized protein n=1 Tax=Mycetomoellerius zeteki TaxID=64791 RepID=A0A151WTN9_9HYME|nr:hypothetical protein ALC60_09668 [Trachymyrmex zeteki]